MMKSKQNGVSQEQMILILEAQKKKTIVENINIKNYDALVFIEREIAKVSQIICAQRIETVAIYGMGYVGQKLRKVLQDAGVQICYGIDKNASEVVEGLKVIKPEEISADMDMILVTPELYYDEIVEGLAKNVMIPVVRLSEFLDEIKIYL